jgi:hypothetical protein
MNPEISITHKKSDPFESLFYCRCWRPRQHYLLQLVPIAIGNLQWFLVLSYFD